MKNEIYITFYFDPSYKIRSRTTTATIKSISDLINHNLYISILNENSKIYEIRIDIFNDNYINSCSRFKKTIQDLVNLADPYLYNSYRSKNQEQKNNTKI